MKKPIIKTAITESFVLAENPWILDNQMSEEDCEFVDDEFFPNCDILPGCRYRKCAAARKTYDAKGNKISEVSVSSDVKTINPIHWSYEYYEDGNTIYKKIERKRNIVREETFDKSGNTIHYKEYDAINNGESYFVEKEFIPKVFNEEGLATEWHVIDVTRSNRKGNSEPVPEKIIRKEYNENGQIIQELILTKSCLRSRNFTNIEKKQLWEYKDGRLRKHHIEDNVLRHRDLPLHEKFTYNEDGTLRKKLWSRWYEDGSEMEFYTYKYDEFGNWIARFHKPNFDSADIDRVDIRTIKYYEE